MNLNFSANMAGFCRDSHKLSLRSAESYQLCVCMCVYQCVNNYISIFEVKNPHTDVSKYLFIFHVL